MTKLRVISVEIDIDKIRQRNIIEHSRNRIIDEFREEFSKALYADLEDRDKYAVKLVRGIVQKFHLY